MPEICMLNVNDRALMLAQQLKATGRITDWRVEDSNVCVEFEKGLEITLADFYQVLDPNVAENWKRANLLLDIFKKEIIIPAMKSIDIREAEVAYVSDTAIIISPKEKLEEKITIRVNKREKEELEKLAKERGISVSDAIRALIKSLISPERKEAGGGEAK